MLTTLVLAAMLIVNTDMVSQVTEVDVQADRPAWVLTVAGPVVVAGEIDVDMQWAPPTMIHCPPTTGEHLQFNTSTNTLSCGTAISPHEIPAVSDVILDEYLRVPVVLTPATGD